ncbi:hypothetical protein MTO96_004929 [Rhipicephalus appendiculatus]
MGATPLESKPQQSVVFSYFAAISATSRRISLIMDSSSSYEPLQPDIDVEIKQEPVSPPSSDIEEEEYVTSDLYGSPHFPHLTVKKEEPTSSPEASPNRSPAFRRSRCW